MSKREDNIQKLMKLRGYDYETAKQIVLDDEAVDKGEPLPWDLTPEQKKVQKQARQADREVGKTEKRAKTVKENPQKAQLIADLAKFLEQNVENVEILNKERQISFDFGEEKYELTLVQKRKPKKSS